MPIHRSRLHAAELACQYRDGIPITWYSQLGSPFNSPKWVGGIVGIIWEIAALILLIKRPAVAPNSEQSDTKDFHPAPLLLSMSVH